MRGTSSIPAAARRRLIGVSPELIKDDEASGRKIGKEGLSVRATGVSVERFYARRGRMGRRGDSIRTNTLLYQELEVLANYIVYRMYSEEENTARQRNRKVNSCPITYRPFNAIKWKPIILEQQ